MTQSNLFFRVNSLYLIFLVIFFYSCSKNSEVDNPNSEEDFVPFAISAVAKNSDSIYQVDVMGDTADIEVTNLSQTLGIPYDYKSAQINGSTVTFFDFQNNNYAFWQKDLANGQKVSRNPICELAEDEGWRFPLTNGDQIGIITYGVNESAERNFLKIYDVSATTCDRFEIADLPNPQNNYVYLHKERFYLYSHEVGGEEYFLKVINTSNGLLEEELFFNKAFRTIMDEERLYIMLADGSYKIYDLDELTLIDQGSTNNQYLHRVPGIHKSNIKGNKMVFDFPYPQPSAYSSAPAIYDWTTNKITGGDDFYLADVDRELEDQQIADLKLTVVEVDLDSEILVAGYQNLRYTDEGGIVYFTFEGEILMVIPLDYVPFKIMIRD